MSFKDLFYNCQTHTGSGISIPGIQSLEDHKDLIKKGRVDPYPIVLYGKPPGALDRFCGDENMGPDILPAELDRISDQILEYQAELYGICLNDGETLHLNNRIAFLYLNLEVPDDLLDQFITIDRLEGLTTGSNP
jgi:hypothetical protein